MGWEAHLVKPRFARGCRCFAVVVDGSIAGYGWLSTGPEWIGELQLEITPGPAEGYLWNCVTLPGHRRKGIFSSLLIGVSQIARNEGMRRLWIGSVDIPAERAMRPSGFRPALRFRTQTFMGVHSLVVRPVNENISPTEDARAVLGSHEAPLRRTLLIRREHHKVH